MGRSSERKREHSRQRPRVKTHPSDTAQTGAVYTTTRGEDKRTIDTPASPTTHSVWAPSGPASQPHCLHRLQQGTLAPRRADLQGEVLYAATGFHVSVSPSARGRGRKHDNTCLFVILTKTLVGKAKGACRRLGPSEPVYLPLPQPTKPGTSRYFWFQLHKWLVLVNLLERYIFEERFFLALS